MVKQRNEYLDRLFRQEESVEELCKDFPYVSVKRTLKGIMCLTCNEINIIEEKEYYDEFTEQSSIVSDIIYPTKNMQIKYDEDIKKIPQTVYNTYIRARDTDEDNKDVTLFLLRKTLEMLLKDISVQGNNLHTKINNINKKLQVIENGMHEVRKAGNNAVHEHDIDLKDSQIHSMAEKVEIIMKLFYTL